MESKNIKDVFDSFTPSEMQKERMSNKLFAESDNKGKAQMKNTKFKTAAIAAAIAMFCLTSVFAAMNFDILKEFFAGDFSSIQDAVKYPREQITDGRFTLTLEELLTDNHYVFMIYSVEGLTDEAIGELMGSEDLQRDNDFKYQITVSRSPGISIAGSTFFPAHSRELVEKRTATTRYWAYYDEMENVNKEPLTLRLGTMSDEKYITVPTDCNVETKEFVLAGQPYGDVSVRLSPIGIVLEKGVKTPNIKDTSFTEVFFRMKNGEIKTYNQLAGNGMPGFMMATGEEPGVHSPEYKRCKYGSRFFDTIPLSDFKSIIVGSIEYDINNPAKTKSITLDESMYPIEIEALLLAEDQGGSNAWLPVKEVCDKIGADMTWDGDTMIINYRGSKVELADLTGAYIKDGKTIKSQYFSPDRSMFCEYEDKLYINWTALTESLHISAHEERNSVEYLEGEPVENDGVIVGHVTSPRTPQYVTYYVIP